MPSSCCELRSAVAPEFVHGAALIDAALVGDTYCVSFEYSVGESRYAGT